MTSITIVPRELSKQLSTRGFHNEQVPAGTGKSDDPAGADREY
ncbi:hypothetical protein [Nocardia wallacei]|nr:hypothetical protein [Nocardia wallacei]